TAGSSVRFVTGAVGAGGRFKITINLPLPDGQYTAVAVQGNAAGFFGDSPARTFSIKLHAPLVTLEKPAPGANVRIDAVLLGGHAGNVYGDNKVVTVFVYKGSSVRGRRVAKLTATASGGKWSVRWAHPPALGFYTARAVQGD